MSALYFLDGLVGIVTHVQGVRKRPGGFKEAHYNLVMGPPLLAPGSLCLVGALGHGGRDRQARAMSCRERRRGAPGPARPAAAARGTTPQMVGRYPDYDVLAQTGHWDEVTRRVVLDRVENVPPIRFFDAAEEAATLNAFCDVVTAQDAEPRIPVLSYIDEKLHPASATAGSTTTCPTTARSGGGSRAASTTRRAARGFDAFAAAPLEAQVDIVHRFSKAELHGGVWDTMNVARAFSVVMRYVAQAFYSHPWAWNEIGFGGPAYPRGYARVRLTAPRRARSRGRPTESVALRPGARTHAERGLD